MRTRFGRHSYSSLLSPAYELHRSLRAHMSEMGVSASESRQENVANHHYLFRLRRNSLESQLRADDPFVHRAVSREGRLLAVVDDRNLESTRVFQRRSH